MARGAALWESLVESLVGKPRGKATDPLIHAKGSVTLLLQLGMKAHVQVLTRDEDPGGSAVKNLPANTGGSGDLGLILGLGRSPGEGNVYPL